jgi:hypothetical protein
MSIIMHHLFLLKMVNHLSKLFNDNCINESDCTQPLCNDDICTNSDLKSSFLSIKITVYDILDASKSLNTKRKGHV